MVVLSDALDGTVWVRVGAAGAEVAGGFEGLAGGKVWVREGLHGNDEEDVDDLSGSVSEVLYTIASLVMPLKRVTYRE
jgi:hypothetical protein